MKQFILGITISLLSLALPGNFFYRKQPDAKTSVFNAEKSFEKMCADKSIAAGFYAFADENAIIKREHDTLVKGKNNILIYYSKPYYANVTVNWTADFIEVSKSGDLAYTYGKYIWKSKDASGKAQTDTGIFHTVWKKQADGSWKYVWD